MSWGEPKTLAPLAEDSPFFGLSVPEDVTVDSQVVAQPDPTLAARVIAQLTDGTPMVTRKEMGEGSGRAVPRHRQRRVVVAAAVGPLRVHAGAARRVLRAAPASEAELEGDRVGARIGARRLWGAAALDTQPGVPGERIAEGAPGPTCRRAFTRARTGASPSTPSPPTPRWRPPPGPRAVRVEGLDLARELPAQGRAPGAGAGAPPRGRAGLAAPVGAAARAARGAAAALLGALLLGRPTRARRRRPPAPRRRARPEPCPRSSRWPRPSRWCSPMC
jgi:hypothetical protein